MQGAWSKERRDLAGVLRQRIRKRPFTWESHLLRPPASQDQAYAARPRAPRTLGGGEADGPTPVLSAPTKPPSRA